MPLVTALQQRRLARTSRVVVFVLTLAAAAFCIVTLRARTRTIAVVITNQTGHTLNEIVLDFTGGPAQAHDVLDGEIVVVRIRATGPSEVDLGFERSAGEKVTHQVAAHIEPGYGGTIRVSIDARYALDISRDLRLPALYGGRSGQ